MNESFTLQAQPRTLFGKKVSQLRTKNLTPANIFGAGESSIAISLEEKAFKKLFATAGETALIYVTIEGEKKNRPVLVEEVHQDSITGKILHVSLKQVNLKKKIMAEVPVEIIGELGIKGAVLVTVRDVIEVEALPADLPESFEIDASLFTEIGQEVTYNQLTFDRSKVELQIDAEELDQPVVMVQAHVEEVEAAPEEAPAEGETPAAATPEATPAEGEKAA